jgi:hypothetical protein
MAAIGLVACSRGGDDVSYSTVKFYDDRTVQADGTPQRLLWSIADEQGILTAGAPSTMVAQLYLDDDAIGPSMTLARHDDGIARPYYPMIVPFDQAGLYRVELVSDLATLETFTQIGPPGSVPIVGPGDAMPAIETPTSNDPRGVDPICTRSPICPFHELTLTEAIAGDRPTVLMVTTPAFCAQVDICGPSLELLIEEIDRLQPDIDVVHAEVYANPTPEALGDLAPVMSALTTDGSPLWYEPLTFTIDAGGTVVQRLDFAWDRTDLGEAIERLAAP